MSNMTPFEIRLELLKMAKDMLSEEYYRNWVGMDSSIPIKEIRCKQSRIFP